MIILFLFCRKGIFYQEDFCREYFLPRRREGVLFKNKAGRKMLRILEIQLYMERLALQPSTFNYFQQPSTIFNNFQQP
jgi:hypothetical protein